jgi:hypothetical protein
LYAELNAPLSRGSPIAIVFGILTNIRYSIRKYVGARSLSLALLLTIALGIGSNVSVHRLVLGLTKSHRRI